MKSHISEKLCTIATLANISLFQPATTAYFVTFVFSCDRKKVNEIRVNG
jgi:hypothetical protein